MLPFELAPGTSLETLMRELLPRAHREHARGPGQYQVVTSFDGGPAFTLDIDGTEIDVREGAAARPHVSLSSHATTAAHFLDDWSTTRNFLPKFPMPPDLRIVTDAALLRRLALVNGSVELALVDFAPGRASMVVACGQAAAKAGAPADVIMEATMSVFERLLSGALRPDHALLDAGVTLRGKRLVAMQFALALAPFFPK